MLLEHKYAWQLTNFPSNLAKSIHATKLTLLTKPTNTYHGKGMMTIPSRRWWSSMWQSFDPRRASWTFSSLSRRFQLNDKTSEKMQVIKLTIPNHWQEYTNTGNRDLASRCSKSQPESYYNNKETSSNGRQSVFFLDSEVIPIRKSKKD